MQRLGILVSFIYGLFFPTILVSAQDENAPKAEITSHRAGEAVRGIVPITGFTAVEGFISWELTFAYADDTTGTWFLISEGEEPITNDILTEWVTTAITDGIFNLRLSINLEGGRRTHFILPDIRVRNYTPIESETPTPTLTTTPYTLTPQPSRTPTHTLPPTDTPIPDTPTPLPTNPIEISTPAISISFMRGAGMALTAFLIMGLYTTIRKWLLDS